MYLSQCVRGLLLLWLLAACIMISLVVPPTSSVYMLDVDLMVPQSFKPFSNQGSRLGVHTEWSLSTMKIENLIAHSFEEEVAIDKMEEWATLARLDIEAPNIARIIGTIQKATRILKSALSLALYSFILSTLLFLISLALSGPGKSLGDGSEYLASPLLEAEPEGGDEESAEGGESMTRRFLQTPRVYKVTRRLSISGACGRLALLLTLLACFLFLLTLALHYDDLVGNIKKLLPLIIKRISLICLTHNSEECQILFSAKPAAYALVTIITGVFVTGTLSVAAWPAATILVPL